MFLELRASTDGSLQLLELIGTLSLKRAQIWLLGSQFTNERRNSFGFLKAY